MIKYLGEPTITFAEFPDEISLCFSLTDCPCKCLKCSEPELCCDIGEELTEISIISFLEKNQGATLVGFLGGDNDHETIKKLCDVIHAKGLKTGMYSGRDYIDCTLIDYLDYYKIGRWIVPQGKKEDWYKQTCGPIKFPNSNQIMFKKIDKKLVNITEKFRQHQNNGLLKDVIL